MKIINLIGQKFGMLTVINKAENVRKKKKAIYWICKCDCGKESIVETSRLRRNEVKSCGCIRGKRKEKHGLAKSRIYKTFLNMNSRCYNPNASKYYLYGGKGIKVCDEWKYSFVKFYDWAIKSGYNDNLTIDRIDSDKDYCPENCKWVTYKEQNSHLKGNVFFKSKYITYDGETHSLKEWSNIKNIKYKTLLARYERGWEFKKIIDTPIQKKGKNKKNEN